MNYFITGSNGFIGKNLCQHLELYGHSVIKYNRVRPVQIPKDTDGIIHLAGGIYNEDSMFDTNVVLTYELLNATKDIDLKSFIYVGSSSEYGEKKLPMYEHDVLRPRNLYEATKGCGTLLTESFAIKHNLPAAIVRPFSVYGQFEPPHRFIPTLLQATKSGNELIVSPGVHDFIYISDFIKGMLAVEESLRNGITPKGDIVNIGTGVETSNYEVVALVEEITGIKINYKKVDYKLRDFDTMHWKASIRKLQQIYKFTPEYTLKEGLKKLAI